MARAVAIADGAAAGTPPAAAERAAAMLAARIVAPEAPEADAPRPRLDAAEAQRAAGSERLSLLVVQYAAARCDGRCVSALRSRDGWCSRPTVAASTRGFVMAGAGGGAGGRPLTPSHLHRITMPIYCKLSILVVAT